MNLGLYNELVVKDMNETGLYLEDGKGGIVQLPSKEVHKEYKQGDNVNVFIYKNLENEVTATLQKPLIQLYQIAYLKVKETTTSGAFLDWGLEKDLFLPYPEQDIKVRRGERVLVFLTIEPDANRLFASSKLEQFFPDGQSVELERKQKVDLLVWKETDLGFKVVINKEYQGLIYHDEIYKPLDLGEELQGYVKLIREDGKIDVSLQKLGVEAIDANAQKVLEELNKSGGFLELNDKSDPAMIEAMLKMSKKAFKRAIGGLYKSKTITISPEGIKLN